MRSRPLRALRVLPIVGLVIAPVAWASACAPGSGDTSSTSGGSGGSGGAGGDLSGSGGTLFDADIGDGSLTEDSACGVIKQEGTLVPVTLYIMLDKSTSMAGTKWDAAVAGIDAFVNDPAFTGLDVGIKFFPRAPDNVPACDQSAYKTPTVAFGPLPGNAAPISAALLAETPNGFSTPIYPALGGALLAGIEVAINNPGESAAVLLVTDGLPLGPAPTCSGVDPEDQQVIADLAASGAAFDPPVRTFVVGLPGADQTFSNKIAASGGTDAAILVSSSNTTVEFSNALKKVAGEALPCEYTMPEQVSGGEFTTDKVNVLYTPGPSSPSQEPYTLPYDPSCAGEGWFYDDAAKPETIILCPASCSKVKVDLGAKIEILLGCKTVIAS